MSEQSVMTTPIFDELVNELGGAPQEETANEPQQDDQPHTER
jgi:hypothetical protein